MINLAEIDEATQALCDQAALAVGQVLTGPALQDDLSRRNTRGPAMKRVERSAVEAGEGSVEVALFVPSSRVEGLVVYLDMAPWEGGNSWARESMSRRIAERTSCAVLTLDPCSQIPESPTSREMVAALEEARSAVRTGVAWLREKSATTSVLHIVGHGFGALMVANLMGQRDFADIGSAVAHWTLISPAVRDESEVSTDVVVTDPAGLARASDKGTAPVSVHAGSADATIEPARVLAQTLKDHGVHAELKVHDRQMSGFFSITTLPAGERVLQQIITSTRAAIAHAGRAEQKGRH